MSEDLNLTTADETQVSDRSPAGESNAPLGEAGKAALEKERQARKQLEREAAELRELLKNINPEEYERLKTDVERREREKEELNKRLDERTKEQQRVLSEKEAKIQEQNRAIVDLTKRSIASRAYYLQGGVEGSSELTGISNFDAIYWYIKDRIEYNEQDGSTVILSKDKKSIDLTADGKTKTIDDLIAEFSEDATFQHYFKKPQASGGGFVGGNARGGPRRAGFREHMASRGILPPGKG